MGVDAVGGHFYLGDSAKREDEFYEIFWRLLRGLLENVADSVSNGGLEGDASRVESRKVYANELAWLEDCVHRQMFTLSLGKCKSAVPGHRAQPRLCRLGRLRAALKRTLRSRVCEFRAVFGRMADLLSVPDRRVAYRLALLVRPFCRLGCNFAQHGITDRPRLERLPRFMLASDSNTSKRIPEQEIPEEHNCPFR